MSGEITKRLTAISKNLTAEKIAQEAYRVFVSGDKGGTGRFRGTPIKTGYARSHTRLRGATIEAAYPYASRLDEGYSKQAPDGMSRPTEQYIRSWIKRQTKG